ncbi:MAG TPA: C40 family peptidase [Flavobacteriales bacterium]|nr:C40 family peptidase [Flavobacteriales bacterium]
MAGKKNIEPPLYGIASVSLVPCREEPADSSQMVSQLLLGEHFYILERGRKWSKIKIALDGYEAFIDNKQYAIINKIAFLQMEKSLFERLSSDITPAGINGGKAYLVKGSFIHEQVLTKLKVDLQSQIPTAKLHPSQYAREYLNAPYLWGGRSPLGIDCSGLTQMSFLMAGKVIPRDAYQQAEIGTLLDFVEEAQEGDLAFFDNDEGRIVHVGIVLANGHIIHASGKVRIDKLDHQGIYNEETKKYSHKLRIIKRVE